MKPQPLTKEKVRWTDKRALKFGLADAEDVRSAVKWALQEIEKAEWYRENKSGSHIEDIANLKAIIRKAFKGVMGGGIEMKPQPLTKEKTRRIDRGTMTRALPSIDFFTTNDVRSAVEWALKEIDKLNFDPTFKFSQAVKDYNKEIKRIIRKAFERVI